MSEFTPGPGIIGKVNSNQIAIRVSVSPRFPPRSSDKVHYNELNNRKLVDHYSAEFSNEYHQVSPFLYVATTLTLHTTMIYDGT